MNNLFFITSTIPNHNGSGLQQRCYRNIIALNQNSNLNLIIVGHHGNTEADSLYLKELNIKTVVYLKRLIKEPHNFTFTGASILKAASSILTRNIRFDNDDFDVVTTLILETKQFDVFVFRLESFDFYKYIFEQVEFKYRLFLDWDDIESIALERLNNINKTKLGKEIYLANKIRIRNLQYQEKNTVKQCHSIIVCSKLDANSMNKFYKTNIFCSIPNSCNFHKKEISPAKKVNNDVNILFVGSMYYLPNEHGATWFCNEVLPIINANTHYNIKVWIVGYNPTDKVKQLANKENIIVTGSVNSVTEYYQNASFAISPIHFGGGTRIKILEAASYNIATVTTTIGLEGIEFTHKTDVLVADNAEEFAKCCITLSEDIILRESLANSAFKKGKDLYDVSAVALQLESMLG